MEHFLKGEGAKAPEQEGERWQTDKNEEAMNDSKAPELLCPQFMQLLNNNSRKNCTVGRIVQTRRHLCLLSFSGLPCMEDWSKQGSTETNELQCKRLPSSFLSLFCSDFECHVIVHGTSKGWGCGYHNASGTDAETQNGELRRKAHLFMGL